MFPNENTSRNYKTNLREWSKQPYRSFKNSQASLLCKTNECRMVAQYVKTRCSYWSRVSGNLDWSRQELTFRKRLFLQEQMTHAIVTRCWTLPYCLRLVQYRCITGVTVSSCFAQNKLGDLVIKKKSSKKNGTLFDLLCDTIQCWMNHVTEKMFSWSCSFV